MKSKQATLGGDAIRLTASKVITVIITMLTTMLLSRFRTFEEYGTYSQLLLVINLFTTLLMLGLPNSINYFLARAESEDERKKFLSVYYTLSSALSIGIGVVLVLAIPLIESYFHNSFISKFYYVLALYPWTTIISASIENILVVYKKTDYLMLYRLVISLVSLGTVILIQWLGLGFSEYMKAFILTNVFFALSVYVIVGKISGGINVLIDKALIRKILVFSVPIGLASVIGTLNAEIDKLLIGYLLDTEQLAIYTNAAKELPLMIVASSITAVLLPHIARMIKNGNIIAAVKLWGYASELAMIIICLVVAGVFTYAEEVMTILYSAKYLPGVTVFRIYTLNLLLRITYFGIILNAYGETKKILYCSLVSLMLNIVLNPLFYWMFGMIGPAIATFMAIFVIAQLQLVMTTNVTKIPFSQIFPWRRIANLLAINIIFGVVFWAIKRALPIELYVGEIVESIILGAVWSALYFSIMKKRILNRWHKLNNEEA